MCEQLFNNQSQITKLILEIFKLEILVKLPRGERSERFDRAAKQRVSRTTGPLATASPATALPDGAILSTLSLAS